MTSRLAAAVIGPALLILGGETHAQTATDYRCAKGADVRRIEIRFADAAGNLPCKVIYRPENESDTLGIVSWQGLDSAAACVARAREVTGRLTDERWACTPDSSESGADVLTVEKDVDGASPSPPIAAEETPDVAAVDSAQAVIGNTPAIDDGRPSYAEIVDEPARFIDNPDLPSPPPDLVAMIDDDLARLDLTLDGVLEATIAAYGDLNADDIEDALVLYTYTSPQPAYRQFLAAYVFDGESYQLTATKPVSGNVSATMDARVETIDRGVVHLALKAFEPGDASCCPSGTRQFALTLRDLDLVEIDTETPTR